VVWSDCSDPDRLASASDGTESVSLRTLRAVILLLTEFPAVFVIVAGFLDLFAFVVSVFFFVDLEGCFR
jgi:hypothetical protein